MQTTVITIAADQISDWDSFHSVFQAALGFPEFYGRNMNAWIDCMTDIDDPSGGMTNVSVARGGLVALRIDDAPDFERRCPEQYRALIEVHGVRELSARGGRRSPGAYPDARRLVSGSVVGHGIRHCEERSDEAIHTSRAARWIASLRSQ